MSDFEYDGLPKFWVPSLNAARDYRDITHVIATSNTRNENGISDTITNGFLCPILYGWYDQVPGLIGNVERVRYSSGLYAIGGPSA